MTCLRAGENPCAIVQAHRMEVFLIPGRSDRYELVLRGARRGPGATRPRRRAGSSSACCIGFREALAEAERERHRASPRLPRRHTRRLTWYQRVKRATLRRIAESIAEQRLLWHLRRQQAAVAWYPVDIAPDAALQHPAHRAWAPTTIATGAGSSSTASSSCSRPSWWCCRDRMSSALLSRLPPGRATISRCAAPVRASTACSGTCAPSNPLAELRPLVALEPELREARVSEIAERLRLERSRRSSIGSRFRARDRVLPACHSRAHAFPAITVTLRELAERLGCRLEGDGAIEITGVAGLEAAAPGDVTFFANPKYAAALQTTRASAVIVAEHGAAPPVAALRAANPYLAFARRARPAHRRRDAPARRTSVQPHRRGDASLGTDVSIGAFVVIGAGARIGDRVVLHPHVVIGRGARIGNDSVLYPHVSVRERSIIGARVILQDGVVIGSDGYGFVAAPGRHAPQDPAARRSSSSKTTWRSARTRPSTARLSGRPGSRQGRKSTISCRSRTASAWARHSLLAAQVGVAGSTVLGDHVTLAGQVGVAGHLTIGDHVIATAQTGIPNSVEPRLGRLRLSRRSQSRVAEIVGRRPSAARTEAAAHRSRRASRRARSAPGRGSPGRRVIDRGAVASYTATCATRRKAAEPMP